MVCGITDDLAGRISAIQKALAEYKENEGRPFINTGTVINITLNNIQQEIYEKGGVDSEELSAILQEVRKLIQEMQKTGEVKKNPSLREKIIAHADTHGWFYGAIFSTLGQAALMMLL